MHVFLFRHAEAEDSSPDELRELTPKGEKTVGKLCSHLKAKTFENVVKIEHSPLVRAAQTASLLKSGMHLPQPLHERDGLTPWDNPLRLLPELAATDKDILYVGHNPHLSILADALMLKSTEDGLIAFKKCGMLCLRRLSPPSAKLPYGDWQLAWFLVPRALD